MGLFCRGGKSFLGWADLVPPEKDHMGSQMDGHEISQYRMTFLIYPPLK